MCEGRDSTQGDLIFSGRQAWSANLQPASPTLLRHLTVGFAILEERATDVNTLPDNDRVLVKFGCEPTFEVKGTFYAGSDRPTRALEVSRIAVAASSSIAIIACLAPSPSPAWMQSATCR